MIARGIKISRRMLFAFGLAILVVPLICFPHERGLPAQEGIANFEKISDRLFRGAQPDSAAMANLARLGVKNIIDLRLPKQIEKLEEVEARAHGIFYTNLPMQSLGRPADAQVRTILSLVETLPGPVFIHCQYGCDRTGTIIACYRIQHDRWSHVTALQEAARHGMFWFERGMKRFVQDFSKSIPLVSAKPQITALAEK